MAAGPTATGGAEGQAIKGVGMATAYISEVAYAGSLAADFIEVAVLAGTDVTGWTVQVYDGIGQQAVSMTFPAPTATEVGSDIYVFEQGVPSWPTLNGTHSVALIDGGGAVLQYLSFYTPPVTAIDGGAVGETPVYAGATTSNGESLQSDDDGASYYVQSSPNAGTIPCFAPGMMVDCPEGPRAVELLRPGDRVMTLDRGARPLVWTHAREEVFSRADFRDRPVQLRAGVLGATAKLVVSPQHRLLVPGGEDGGVLVPARGLIGQPGVRQMRGRDSITWHHLCLDRHELLRVNGVWTESLLLGPMVMNGLPRRCQIDLRRRFAPVDDGALNGPPARLCLSVGTALAEYGL